MTPRVVEYDSTRYTQSVRTTAAVLAAHGVTAKSRVWVAHPFDPWAIGPVFRDAALCLGAWVLPTGLVGGDPSVLEVVLRMRPTVVCAPGGVLVKWLSRRQWPHHGRSTQRAVFHAGEAIPSATAHRCEQLWNGRFVNVYGLAEFDTVAAQGGTDPSVLTLSPTFEYRLRIAESHQVHLAAGLEGALQIRPRRHGRWFDTRDLVRVVGRSRDSDRLWPRSWTVSHLGRSDARLTLPDGSSITEPQILAAERDLPVAARLQVRFSRARATVLVSVDSDGSPLSLRLVRSVLLARCMELADSVRNGVVSLRVRSVGASISKTPRGKTRTLLEVGDVD